MTGARLAAVLVTLFLAASAAAQDSVEIGQFEWRASITLTTPTVAAQLTLPADAMRALKTPGRHDFRVFNADGQAVATAVVPILAADARSEPDKTRSYRALPLFEASTGQAPAGGSVQVSMDTAGGKRSVWVQLGPSGDTDGAAAPGKPLPAVLLDTRLETSSISSLALDAELPANTLVSVTLASSKDLVRWMPIPVRGPLFRFDGDVAPRNLSLELRQALKLEGHYLRLSWDAATPIRLAEATGILARPDTAPARVSLPLTNGVSDGQAAITWKVDLAGPLAGLQLHTDRANTLVPVRILGRNDTTQAWMPMGQGVVFRIGEQAQEATNTPIALNGSAARWLRVEATHGMTLAGTALGASVELTPLRLVFLTSGKAPFELAVGRAQTRSATVDPSLLRPVVKSTLEDLPQATLEPARLQDQSRWHTPLTQMLYGTEKKRTMVLWLVLVAGVLVLGVTAFALLRQLQAKPERPPDPG